MEPERAICYEIVFGDMPHLFFWSLFVDRRDDMRWLIVCELGCFVCGVFEGTVCTKKNNTAVATTVNTGGELHCKFYALYWSVCWVWLRLLAYGSLWLRNVAFGCVWLCVDMYGCVCLFMSWLWSLWRWMSWLLWPWYFPSFSLLLFASWPFDHPVLASMWLWSSWLLYLKCHRLRCRRGSAGFGGGVWSFRLLLQVVAIHAHFFLSNAGVFGPVTIIFRIGLTFFFLTAIMQWLIPTTSIIRSNHCSNHFQKPEIDQKTLSDKDNVKYVGWDRI